MKINSDDEFFEMKAHVDSFFEALRKERGIDKP